MSSIVDLTGLAVVVVNYGSSDLVAQNLRALTQGHPEIVVVVVDNFSTAGERRAVQALARTQGWTLVESTNVGFGRGVNAGAHRALEKGATELLLLNPDAVLAPADASILLDAVRADPMELVTPVIRRPDGSVWAAGSDLYLRDGRIRSSARRIDGQPVMQWLSGACLMLSAQLWQAVDGFDPDYFLYWEDVDFSQRVLRAGGRLRVVESATAVHAEGGTQNAAGIHAAGAPKSNVYYYYNIRNRLLFGAKHLDAESIEVWLRLTPRIGWEVLLQGGRRQLIRSTGPAVAYWRGVRDGRRVAKRAIR